MRRAVDAMGPERTDATWAYWKAKAMLAGRPSAEEKAEARQLLEDTAGTGSFTNSWHWRKSASASPCHLHLRL